MKMKKVKPAYKATAKATPCKKSTAKVNPWETAVLEMFLKMEEEGIDEDLSEELYDIVHKCCDVPPVNLNRMIDAHRTTKQEAERFQKILAMKTLQDAWKSLSAEQQELLRDMDAHSFVDQVTE